MTTTSKTGNNTANSFPSVLAGQAGQFLTAASNGTSYTTSWAAPPQNFVSNNGQPIMTIPNGEQTVVLEQTATLDVKGTVKINGVDLEERLKTIEKVLLIPERDVKLEAKHPKLKKLYDEYIAALGKYRTFESIKGND